MKGTLRQWRKFRDLTIKEASKRIGVSEVTIISWEHGSNPSSKYISAIEKAYDIKWSDDVLMD
jgi:transcriptional regulator with XRE-family HTH domain